MIWKLVERIWIVLWGELPERGVRCRLGFHDWEYLRFEHPDNLWFEYTNQGLRVSGTGTSNFLRDRVCICCEEREDQITPYLRTREQEAKQRANRSKIVRQIAGCDQRRVVQERLDRMGLG